EIEQRGLAAARGTGQRDELAARDRQIDRVQRLHPQPPQRVTLAHALQRDDVVGRHVSSPCTRNVRTRGRQHMCGKEGEGTMTSGRGVSTQRVKSEMQNSESQNSE